MRALTVILTLAACAPSAPHVGVGVGVGPGGTTVTPHISTRYGPASVGVSPYGASVGTSIGNLGLALGGAF